MSALSRFLRSLACLVLALVAANVTYILAVPGHYLAVARFTRAEPAVDAVATASATRRLGEATSRVRLYPIGTSVVEVRAYTRSWTEAVSLANGYADTYVAAARAQVTAAAAAAAAPVERQREALHAEQARLKSRIDLLERDAAGVRPLRVVEADFLRRRSQAQRDRSELATAAAQIQGASDLASIPFVAAAPAIRSLTNDLAILEAARRQTSPAAENAGALDAAIAQARNQIRDIATSLVAQTQADFDHAVTYEATLEQELATVRAQLAEFDARHAEAQRLRRQLAVLGTRERQLPAITAGGDPKLPSVLVAAAAEPAPTRRAVRVLRPLTVTLLAVVATLVIVGWYQRRHRLAHHAQVAMRAYQDWRPQLREGRRHGHDRAV